MPDSPEAVFFDLDGTLIDTAPDMGGALNRLLQRHNKPPVAEHVYRPQVSHGSIALLKLGFPAITDSNILSQLRTDFLTEYANNIAAHSRLFAGITPLLARLDASAIPWGIITNKPEYLTLNLLEQLQLKDRCCCIVGADTAVRAKPHPEPMELACKLSDVTSTNCIYVGDAERDIQAGLSVGMLSLVAGWGYIDPEIDDPESWGAHATLMQPADLDTFI